MTPIRIGFIGLSANGGWGPSAHWPYLKQTDKYQVVAVCNSSVESSEKAKTHFGLPESTKSYGSPKDLAADPNVDLVVCGVRVDEHYAAIKPALEAKKAVYCEWPLGANVEEAHELADLAKGGKSMVGLQARQAPVILQVRELVESKRFGKVLSSAVVSSGGNFGPTEIVKMKYFNDKKVGGNMMSIHFGHMIDFVTFAIDELKDLSGRVSVQRPRIDILKDGEKVETMTRDSWDQIMLHGEFESGAVLSVHQRGGAPFKGESGLLWRIYCEKGEIQVTAGGSFLQVGYPDMKIQVHDHEKDTAEEVSFEGQGVDVPKDLPLPAQNVARMYEVYAAGGKVPSFDDALFRHRTLASIEESSSKKAVVSYM